MEAQPQVYLEDTGAGALPGRAPAAQEPGFVALAASSNYSVPEDKCKPPDIAIFTRYDRKGIEA